MKIKWGALMVDGRGKIGGQVASKNRGGAYMRNKVTPVNPQTTYQTSIRSAFTVISQTWRTLTAAERLSFNSAVGNFSKTDIFGDIKNPSGANLHERLNLNLFNIGQPYITSAPPLGSAPITFEFTMTANSTTGAVTISSAMSIPAGFTALVSLTTPQSAGRSFIKNQYRVVTTFTNTTTFPINIGTAYAARLGALSSGSLLGCKIKVIDNATGVNGQSYSATTIII
jgi:hypothetical protein